MKKRIHSTTVRICAFALALSMIITLVPVYAIPAETENTEENTVNTEQPESVDTTAEWTESDVTGSDAPTLKAKKPEDFSANYKGEKKAEDHLYTMTVSTGIKAGTDSVEHFSIRYKDVNNVSQTKYILMDTDPLKESYDYMSENGGENTELKTRHEKLSSLNYTINEPASRQPLTAWSVDEFLFTTEEDIASITGVDIFMSDGSWAVQGVVISEVTSVSGYGESGFYSGNYFFGLGKKRICELEKKKSSTTISAKGDVLIQLAGGKSQLFSLKTIKDSKEDASPFHDMFTFRMDFADTLDGGIESYMKQSADNESPIPDGFVEHLALEVEYKDKNGWTRTVTMPVMLSVLGQYATSGDTVKTMGLAQRGETVAFTGYLPEYSSLISTKLYTGSVARERLASTGGFNAINNGMSESLDGDKIGLAGISIYKGTCRLSNTEDGTDSVTGEKLTSYTTAVSFSESSPVYYYTTNTEGGRALVAGATVDINMKEYNSKDPLIATPYSGNFLIRLMTDSSTDKAGTTGNVTTKLSYYSADDKEKTSAFDVKAMTREYMGYWPLQSETNDDYAYSYGMKPGNYVEFLASIDDVAEFSRVDISLSDGADEYQISGISVCTVENIGRRRIYKQNTTSNGDSSSFRIVRSNTHGDVSPFPMIFSEPQLLTGGDYKSFGLLGSDGSNVSGGTTTNNVYEANRYSMTYEQAKSDLGFIRKSKSYDVNVYVADDSNSSNSNGDSGSKNKFYFQFQFTNGNSGVVLANQQLSADGFRAGYQEMFSFTVNRDYGALKSVRILPEDVSSDSEVFDKLNIQKITVTEKTNGGAGMQYIFDSVGWVGIDYHDSAEAGSIRGREGRTLGELSSRYTVSSQRQVVSLLCEVATVPSDIKDDLANQASVCCDLNYLDTNDQPQTISFDIIARMADYMNMTAKTYEAPTDGSAASYYKNMGTISDPEWMLRPSHTDRFILPAIPNLKTVKSMTIYGTNRANGTTHWSISGISISEILSDGALQLTSDNEYYRNLTTSPLCMMISTREKETLTLPMGVAESISVNFSENELVWKEGESWVTPVTRLPEAESDTVNVFIYPTENSRNIDNANVRLGVQYAMPFSQVMQATQNNLSKSGSGTADAKFYATGLSTKGMERLVSIGIKCIDSKMTFDHAMVQHVREGVVISNYYIPLMGASATLGLTGKASGESVANDKKVQMMYLSMGTDTKESTIFAEENDIAVSFKYKSSVDNGEGEYYSPFVYVTDAGYSKIRGGQMLEIPFEIPYVTEITGYRIVSFGELEGEVDDAMVVNYSYGERKVDEETGEVSYTDKSKQGVYSFNDNKPLVNSIGDVTDPGVGLAGDNTLNLLDLSFKTAEATSTEESGTDTSVAMTFHYIDHLGRERTRAVSDIRPYIQAENRSFDTGENSRIKIFLPECNELLAIDIMPYNDEGNASWAIESISGTLGLGDVKINRTINKTFSVTENTTIYLKEVKINTSISYGPVNGNRTNASVVDHAASIVLNSGETCSIAPNIEGGGGYSAKAVRIEYDVETDVTSDVLKRGDGTIIFTAPENTSSSEKTYKVIVRSSQNSDLYDTIKITVPPKQVAQDASSSSSEESSSNQSSDASSSSEQEQSTESSSSEPE